MSQANPLLIAQITDTHLFANEDQELLGLPSAKSFNAVLAHLQKLQPQPDILLLTGDLSQDGKLESYRRLSHLVGSLKIPTYWIPGNHDEPVVMHEGLNYPGIFAEKSFEVGGWRFLLLSSHQSGCVHGRISSESLSWLDSELKLHSQLPTLIALHHPPFLVESAWLDTSTLANSDEFFAVIDQYPQVKLVLFGHIHQEFNNYREGVCYLGSPSTSVQFAPRSQEFALDQINPGFRLIYLHPDGSLNTHIERVSHDYKLVLVSNGY